VIIEVKAHIAEASQNEVSIMIVKCKAMKPSDEQAAALAIELGRLQSPYAVTVGKSYVVLGLVFGREPSLLGTDGAITYTENNAYILSAPLVMFDIVDATASAIWVMRRSQMGDWCLQPPSFFAEYYADRLSDGDPEFAEDFQRVYAELRKESGFEISR
jgi:hypothetical protein